MRNNDSNRRLLGSLEYKCQMDGGDALVWTGLINFQHEWSIDNTLNLRKSAAAY